MVLAAEEPSKGQMNPVGEPLRVWLGKAALWHGDREAPGQEAGEIC